MPDETPPDRQQAFEEAFRKNPEVFQDAIRKNPEAVEEEIQKRPEAQKAFEEELRKRSGGRLARLFRRKAH